MMKLLLLTAFQISVSCFERVVLTLIYIYMERYNKSTMPESAEKYFNGPPGIRTHDLGNTA